MAALGGNSVFHLNALLSTRRYSPGVVTGVLFYLPFGVGGYIYFLSSGYASFLLSSPAHRPTPPNVSGFEGLGAEVFMDSDTQVFQDIVAEFKDNRILHYTQLTLHVQDGVVTISGRVNTLAERKAVERAASRVAGVRTLILEIRAVAIPPTVANTETGPAIEEAV